MKRSLRGVRTGRIGGELGEKGFVEEGPRERAFMRS